MPGSGRSTCRAAAAVVGAPPASLHPELGNVLGDDGPAQWDPGASKFTLAPDPALGLSTLTASATAPIILEGKVDYAGDREVRAWVRLHGSPPYVVFTLARAQRD